MGTDPYYWGTKEERELEEYLVFLFNEYKREHKGVGMYLSIAKGLIDREEYDIKRRPKKGVQLPVDERATDS